MPPASRQARRFAVTSHCSVSTRCLWPGAPMFLFSVPWTDGYFVADEWHRAMRVAWYIAARLAHLRTPAW